METPLSKKNNPPVVQWDYFSPTSISLIELFDSGCRAGELQAHKLKQWPALDRDLESPRGWPGRVFMRCRIQVLMWRAYITQTDETRFCAYDLLFVCRPSSGMTHALALALWLTPDRNCRGDNHLSVTCSPFHIIRLCTISF